MSDILKGLAPAAIDLQHHGLQGTSIGKHPISPKTPCEYDPIAVYSTAVMAAMGMLVGLMLTNFLGFPETISRPCAVLVLVIILHPIALPCLLATLIAGVRSAHGPATGAAWDVAFLASFAPYLLLLCWLIAGRLRAGRRGDALRLAALVGLYICVIEFIVLSQDTIVGLG